ncbi:MAG: hypothetical protein ACRDYV_01280 [Acidimicrobiia bacterium]
MPTTKTVSRNGRTKSPVVNGTPARAEVLDAEHSHMTLVAGDPPMFRLEISLYSWERGDSEIEITLPHGGELSELLQWALPEQRMVICGNLRARVQEELAEVFELLQEPPKKTA